MAIAYSITPELRIKLKEPLGTLIRGSFVETMRIFKRMIEKETPVTIISVGDTVSRNLTENQLLPKLSIVDNRVMRRKAQPFQLQTEKTIYVENPAATITEEAVKAIKDALECNCRIKIVVEGEEDLLTLIAVLYAPENSFVIYGQPREGIVAIKVTTDKKAEIAGILKAMETVRKAK
jgi:uncharacterized protein (UPF0218 family)